MKILTKPMSLKEIDQELIEISQFLKLNRNFTHDLDLKKRADLLLDMRLRYIKNFVNKITK